MNLKSFTRWLRITFMCVYVCVKLFVTQTQSRFCCPLAVALLPRHYLSLFHVRSVARSLSKYYWNLENVQSEILRLIQKLMHAYYLTHNVPRSTHPKIDANIFSGKTKERAQSQIAYMGWHFV